MAQLQQYLRFSIGGVPYLLPAGVSIAIEQRPHLQVNSSGRGRVCAWRERAAERWPAYCLDRDFRAVQREDWESAIYLRARPQPVGIAASGVQLLGLGEVSVVPFRPLGPPPTPAGHIFNGACMREDQSVALVFAPAMLASFLQSLGD